ncbi:MAG TPA: hypothetical protein VFT51_15810 [Bacillales bacterium]|nr:hypothetical protein [Bacillales bacterium]
MWLKAKTKSARRALKEEVRDRHSSEEAYAEDFPVTEARTAHK